MSSARPPPAPDEDATLSTGISRGLKPWQIICIIVGIILVLSLFIDFKGRLGGGKKDDGAMLAAGVGGTGEKWSSPTFPAPTVEPVVAKAPSPLVQGVQAPSLSLNSGAIPDIRMAGQPSQPPQQVQGQAQGQARAEPEAAAGKTAIAYKGSQIPGAKAGVIRNPALTLQPQVIPCNLINAIDSSHAGPLQCEIPVTIYSRLGVPLMKRGTTVIGSYTTATQGNHRIMAVSALATTPDDIIVPLGGPMADELGRTGLDGEINNKWWERFGPAVLLTLLNGGINAGTAYLQSNRNNTNSPSSLTYLNFNQGNSVETMAQEALRNSINIPPTIEVNHSATIALWVLGPIDFSEALALKVTR